MRRLQEDLGAALRSIIERDSGLRKRADTLPVLVGKEEVGEDDYTKDGVVTIGEHGIQFWIRVDHDRICPIVPFQIDGLAGFMSVVMWPWLMATWNEDRLMAELAWTAQERTAIDTWELGKADLRRLMHRDHSRRLHAYPELRDFYFAVHRRDAARLRQYTGTLPGRVAQIDGQEIQIMVQAIDDGDRGLVLSQGRFLVHRAAMIAFMESNNYDVLSNEQAALSTRVVEQSQAVRGLAQRRYAAQFLDFCLSQEMLDLHDRHFGGVPESGREAYCRLITSFVGKQLEMGIEGQVRALGERF